MFIRGVDFARANIIVGNDDDAPAPQQNKALVDRGVIEARVLAASGAEATIEVDGQRLVVQTHVALHAGDKLFVKVQEAAGNSIRLSILTSEPEGGVSPALGDPDLDNLLSELGVPADDRTRTAARALLARDGTVAKPALKQLLRSLGQFPQLTGREAGAAALLQKANVAVTPQTVAVMAARAEPTAAPELGARLSPLLPALVALRRQGGEASPLAASLDDLIGTLEGLPLGDQATPPRVATAFRRWIDKLTPPEAKERAAVRSLTAKLPRAPDKGGGAKAEAPVGDQDAPALESVEGQAVHASVPLPRPVRNSTADAVANIRRLLQQGAPAPEGLFDAVSPDAQDPRQAKPGSVFVPRTPKTDPPDPAAAGKQGLERSERVSTSQNIAPRVGINNVARAIAAPDLASQLERLAKDLGPEHAGLKKMIGEAVAEVRYTQITNAPPPAGTPAGAPGQADYLVPLLLPQLNPEHPEGKIQVYHQRPRPGEPIDPRNVRLVFVLETEHLDTVQADVSIKDGVINLTMGVPEAEGRQFLADHIEELEGAIAALGWETGRFNTRQARGLPPKTRQEEGLGEIVRFDRRV